VHCYHADSTSARLLHRALVAAFLGQLPSDSRGDSPQLTLSLHRVRRFAQRCGLLGAATTLHIHQQQKQQQPLAQSHGDSPVHIRSMAVAEFDLVARECYTAAAAAGGSSSGSSSSSSELSLQLFCELLLKLALRRCSSTATSTTTAAAYSISSTTNALAAALYLLSVLEGAASGRISGTAITTARSTPERAR
jgi:hypothetical protein